MSETRYYFGDVEDLDGMTREEVFAATVEDDREFGDLYEDLITDSYGTVTVAGLEWDAGRVLRDMDPIAFQCGLSDMTVEVDLDDYPDDEYYAASCPACGEFIDYCHGHGEIGDPDGASVLASHDEGDHSRCVIDCI